MKKIAAATLALALASTAVIAEEVRPLDTTVSTQDGEGELNGALVAGGLALLLFLASQATDGS